MDVIQNKRSYNAVMEKIAVFYLVWDICCLSLVHWHIKKKLQPEITEDSNS